MNVQVRPASAAEQEWPADTPADTDAAAAIVPRPEIKQSEARGRLVWPQAVGLIVALNVVGWAPILVAAWLLLG
jgi:Tfp pilus assembly protein FimV